jgi:DNA-binding transcriptional LysR family regulator
MPPQSLRFLDVDKLNADPMCMVAHHAPAHAPEHQTAPDRRPLFHAERRPGNRDVDDVAIQSLAGVENNRFVVMSGDRSVVPALLHTIENIAIDEPG